MTFFSIICAYVRLQILNVTVRKEAKDLISLEIKSYEFILFESKNISYLLDKGMKNKEMSNSKKIK